MTAQALDLPVAVAGRPLPPSRLRCLVACVLVLAGALAGAAEAPVSPGPASGVAVTAGLVAPPVDPVVAGEAIGRLRVGMGDAELLGLLGPPSDRPPGAPPEPGRVEAVWRYAAQGLTLTLSAPGPTAPMRLESVVADAGCTLRTRAGIGIGSTREDVRAAYGLHADAGGMDNLMTVELADGYLDLSLEPGSPGRDAARVTRMTLSGDIAFAGGPAD